MVNSITVKNKKEIVMKCNEKIVDRFIVIRAKNDVEYSAMVAHIVNCKKCFKKLISLAPKYNSEIEE
jgi:hypothetical protein